MPTGDLINSPPPLPKRALLPKNRPSLEGMAIPPPASAPSRLKESLDVLEILNRAPAAPKSTLSDTPKGQSSNSKKTGIDRLSPKLFNYTLAFVTFLFFTSAALAFVLTSENFSRLLAQTKGISIHSLLEKRRGLKENSSPSDPSSPALESSGPGDPFPALKPPSKPNRD